MPRIDSRKDGRLFIDSNQYFQKAKAIDSGSCELYLNVKLF